SRKASYNMMIEHVRWLWADSTAVCDGKGITLFSRRIRFFLKAIAVYGEIKPMIDASPESPLGELMRHRPEVVGAVTWPYQCTGWSASTRLARIRDHYAVVEQIGRVVDFPVDSKILLLDLGDIRDGFQVVVDQPVWFIREGQLAINLFLGDVRMYTLAFSLF